MLVQAKIKCPSSDPQKYDAKEVVVQMSTDTTIGDIKNFLQTHKIVEKNRGCQFRSPSDPNNLLSNITLGSLSLNPLELECHYTGVCTPTKRTQEKEKETDKKINQESLYPSFDEDKPKPKIVEIKPKIIQPVKVPQHEVTTDHINIPLNSDPKPVQVSAPAPVPIQPRPVPVSQSKACCCLLI